MKLLFVFMYGIKLHAQYKTFKTMLSHLSTSNFKYRDIECIVSKNIKIYSHIRNNVN